MALVSLRGVSKRYEAQPILCNVEFHLKEGERIALVGRNGSGKSTFLKIIAGVVTPDGGEVIRRQGLKIGFLSQTPQFRAGVTVREAIEEQLEELKKANRRYLQLAEKLGKEPENRALQRELEQLSNYLDYHNGWNLEERIKRVLQQLKLEQFQDRPVIQLSGGEQRRVALAALLLQKPDLLLLDEPTNHLDVYMTQFLEEILLRDRYTFIVISHDRYFIDRVATRVVELENCKLRSFKGGYLDYIRQKEELLSVKEKQFENLLRLLKREEEWLRKGVRGRLKRNEGRRKRVEELKELLKEERRDLKSIEMQLRREFYKISEEKVNRRRVLFEIKGLSKEIGGRWLIKNFSTRILQRDKIGIVGPNGSGKSTFLKLLIGEEEPTGGVIKRADGLKIGYLDQRKSILDDSKDLIETFCPEGGDRVNVRGRNFHVYGYLREFLFPPEHLTKKIGVLSGGEKMRVALALLFTKEFDLLILDEPTNDLDIPTINILEEYLLEFEGGLVVVSHDRYFLDKVAKKLFIFKGDGEIEESYLSYSDYLELERELGELREEAKKVKQRKPQPRPPRKQRKLSYKEQRELEQLPEILERLEGEIAQLEGCLSNPECYQREGLEPLFHRLEELRREYDQKLERYLELEEKREQLKEA
ncbi:MAG: ribosomal protection-like ABC-F family protein [Campylobacterales bacterium]